MLIDFIEVENFLNDPNEIVLLAKQQTYVERSAHYHNVNNGTYFLGVRSKSISDIHKEVHESIYNQISKKILNCEFTCQMYFHVMREQDKFGEGWLHKDDRSKMAGVIYLNPSLRPNTGTIVYRYGEDKDPVIAKNIFNKLVMYNSNYLHSPENGFGTDLNDSRLALVFFINMKEKL
jgi:hypothetical protein